MKKLNKFRISCIVILWIVLCVMLLVGHGGFNLQVVLTLLTSGIVVFVPIYKQYRREKRS